MYSTGPLPSFYFFFFNDTAPTEIYPLSLHDALPISFQRRLSPELWRRIEFKTNLSPAQVAAEMSLATILVLPTRADTSPNAVKEAVVAGLTALGLEIGRAHV